MSGPVLDSRTRLSPPMVACAVRTSSTGLESRLRSGPVHRYFACVRLFESACRPTGDEPLDSAVP